MYLNLTHQLYSFLARRTNSNFNQVVAKRLAMSRSVRCPLSVAKLVRAHKKRPNDTIVVVGTITDDCRILTVPKVECLCFSCFFVSFCVLCEAVSLKNSVKPHCTFLCR